MKRIAAALLIVTGCALSAMHASAQVSISVNIGSQPMWGPVGYERADYYYLPDVEAYYYVPRKQFIYLNGGRWVFAANLPGRYRGYDLYSGYKVVINQPRPYDHFYDHRSRYARYRNWRGRQECLRDNRGQRHYDNDRGHRRGNKHDRGRGRGRGHDRDWN